MTRIHGTPCWYELSTGKAELDAAGQFYAALFGWQIADAGMEGWDYRLAQCDGDMVAGLMPQACDPAETPPHWMLYVAVEDTDATAEAIRATGGRICREPADIPGTGRFAVATDPQGAVFGILAPDPMEPDCDGGGAGGAFDQRKAGHGNWHELMSSDPAAGFDFYSGLFGWEKSTPFDMGGMGVYQLFSHDGTDIGGMMGLGNAPAPCWLPYFGVDGVLAAMKRIEAAGGSVLHGPTEVPGPAFIAVARDPQGAHFAIVGPKT